MNPNTEEFHPPSANHGDTFIVRLWGAAYPSNEFDYNWSCSETGNNSDKARTQSNGRLGAPNGWDLTATPGPVNPDGTYPYLDVKIQVPPRCYSGTYVLIVNYPALGSVRGSWYTTYYSQYTNSNRRGFDFYVTCELDASVVVTGASAAVNVPYQGAAQATVRGGVLGYTYEWSLSSGTGRAHITSGQGTANISFTDYTSYHDPGGYFHSTTTVATCLVRDDGGCLVTASDQFVADGVVRGCTDVFALNYNQNATEDDGSCVYRQTRATPTALGGSLALDAHRRPLAVLPGGTGAAPALSGDYSNDAGHTFAGAALGPGSDPSLLIDTRTNAYRIIYSSTGLKAAFGTLHDGYVPDAASPSLLAGLSGCYPVAAQHPTDRDYVLLAYLDTGDSNSLKTAFSGDGGAAWTALATVATRLDFSASGRPGLAWLGEAAFLIYSVGASLMARKSLDRGKTWASSVTIAAAPTNPSYNAAAYSGLSLLGWQGRLYLLAWGLGATGTTLSPALWVSPDLGATWTVLPGDLPAGLAPPTALGVIPFSGQLRLGITHHSDDDGLTWAPD